MILLVQRRRARPGREHVGGAAAVGGVDDDGDVADVAALHEGTMRKELAMFYERIVALLPLSNVFTAKNASHTILSSSVDKPRPGQMMSGDEGNGPLGKGFQTNGFAFQICLRDFFFHLLRRGDVLTRRVNDFIGVSGRGKLRS